MELLEILPTTIAKFNIGPATPEENHWIQMQIESDWANSPRNEQFGRRSTDERILNHSYLKERHDQILECCHQYNKEHTKYDLIDIVFTQSWVSEKRPGEYHTSHTHPNSMFSGIWYFDPEMNERDPHISFSELALPRPISFGELPHPQEHSIKPESGDVYIFPSTLHHHVPVNENNRSRWSLPFNTFPKGFFGSHQSLTGVSVDWLM